MVEANAFARSLVLIRLEVNIQHSSVLKCFKVSLVSVLALRYVQFVDYQDLFHRLEIGMHRVSEELTKYYKKCKQQLHLKCPKSSPCGSFGGLDDRTGPTEVRKFNRGAYYLYFLRFILE